MIIEALPGIVLPKETLYPESLKTGSMGQVIDQLGVQTGDLSFSSDLSQTIKGVHESLIHDNRLPFPRDPLVMVAHDHERTGLSFEVSDPGDKSDGFAKDFGPSGRFD